MAAPTQTPFDAIPPQLAGRVALSRAEVATTLGCSEAFVGDLIADGTLRAKRVRRKVLVIANDVWKMLGLAAPPGEMSTEAREVVRGMG